MMIPEKLKKYKKLIKVKNYYPDMLVDYLYKQYPVEDITNIYKKTYHYKVLMASLKDYAYKTDEQVPVVLKVLGKNAGQDLYIKEGLDENFDFIYVFIEKISGFFETNSMDICYQLTLERGASQSDYDEESLFLIEAISTIDLYMNGVSEASIVNNENIEFLVDVSIDAYNDD